MRLLYNAAMRWFVFAALFLVLAPAAAVAGAGNFNVVNATGLNILTLEIRRTGSENWQPLSAKPPAGARGAIAFNDPDCAFDIKARLTGNVEAIWPAVNLCEVKSVTLNRSASGALWVDYD